MNLWIRSQDRMDLRPNPKLAIEVIRESYYITDIYEFDKSNILGKYQTKERALEVLDEIQDLLVDKVSEKHINKFDIFNGENVKVFEMPKE